MTPDKEAFERLAAQIGRNGEAASTWRAAARGNVAALYELATWLIVGQPFSRDLALARSLLRRAAGSRHGDAALLEIALTANGSGGPIDWSAASGLLASAAIWDPTARRQLAIVTQLDLDADGNPRTVAAGERVSDLPDVQIFRGLVSADECALIAHTAVDLLRPAQVADPVTGRLTIDRVRISDAAVIGPMRENLVVAAVNRRLAAATRTNLRQGEPLAVMRYAPGQRYRRHLDTLPNTANQRTATAIIYLNEGYAGGRTLFHRSGIEIDAQAGDVLVFRNTLPNGQPDPASVHEGLPIRAGNKWIATRWIRGGRLDPWDRSTW